MTDHNGRVLCDGAAGGMVGQVISSNALTDCFACVHVGWATSNSSYIGAGMVSCYNLGSGSDYSASLTRCVSTGKVEFTSWYKSFGLVSLGTADNNSCFDKNMMSSEFASTSADYAKVPSAIISGAMLASAKNWQTEAHRYPMLKLFADTPYGDLLSMPVLFADEDCAGNITKVFEFPTENVSWKATNGSTYVDIIASCGAASPVSATGNSTEYLIAQTSGTVKSQATKALRVMAIDVNVSETPGLTFEDNHAETACLTAFDKDSDGKLTLREAVTATSDQFTTFNSHATNVTTFRELRYFVGLTELSSNQSDASEGSILTLGRNSDGDVGFYYYRGTSIPPYRAYLTYNSVQDARAYFTFVINDDLDDASGIRSHSLSPTASDEWFDLSGRRIDGHRVQRGLYIHQGKKIVIK